MSCAILPFIDLSFKLVLNKFGFDFAFFKIYFRVFEILENFLILESLQNL
jgi:hypothetical protein